MKLEKYGLGSCGPRGFLGSFSSHLMLERDLEVVVDQPAIVFSSYASVVLSAVQAMAPDFVISFKNSRPEIQRLIQAVKVIEVDYEDFLQGKLPEGLESLLKMRRNKWIVFDAFDSAHRPVDLPKILQFHFWVFGIFSSLLHLEIMN